MTKSLIKIERFKSKALTGNPLKDPTVRNVPVYLPPGYNQNNRRFPVVYILAGFTGRGLMLLNDSLWDDNIQERMDRLIQTGKVDPMILVLPDACTRYGGSQYLNSTATGQYQDHILELVGWIDKKYRTLPEREQRAVIGKSSGGYGAMIFGMFYPEIFGMVGDHSGDKYFELCYKPDIPKFLRFYQKAGQDGLLKLLADPGDVTRKDASAFPVLNIAAMAACYSPNSGSPFGFDLPFDLQTGEIIEDVWHEWEKKDPVHLIENKSNALKSLNLLFFDCGDQDEFNLLYGARIFAKKLTQHGISYHFEEFQGGHRNIQYRYDVSLSAVSNVMR